MRHPPSGISGADGRARTAKEGRRILGVLFTSSSFEGRVQRWKPARRWRKSPIASRSAFPSSRSCGGAGERRAVVPRGRTRAADSELCESTALQGLLENTRLAGIYIDALVDDEVDLPRSYLARRKAKGSSVKGQGLRISSLQYSPSAPEP